MLGPSKKDIERLEYKIDKLKVELNGESYYDTSKDEMVTVPGEIDLLNDRVSALEFGYDERLQLDKLKAIVAELCDYVYRENK